MAGAALDRPAGRAAHGRCAARPARTRPCAQWLQALGQTPRLIALLWEPLAVAALNQSIDTAAASSFAVVIDRILESRAASALGLAVTPLSDLYAAPARVVRRGARAAPCGRAAPR